MKKKLLFALLTLIAVFTFAFSIGVNTYAEEVTDDSTTTTDVEETTSSEEEDAPAEKEDKPLITDEEAQAIATIIGNNTSKEMENLTMTLYAQLGVMGIVLVIVVIVIVYLVLNKAKNDAQVKAIVNSISSNLSEENKNHIKQSLDLENASVEKLTKMLTDILNAVKESKTIESAKTKAELDSMVDELVNKAKESKVE